MLLCLVGSLPGVSSVEVSPPCAWDSRSFLSLVAPLLLSVCSLLASRAAGGAGVVGWALGFAWPAALGPCFLV